MNIKAPRKKYRSKHEWHSIKFIGTRKNDSNEISHEILDEPYFLSPHAMWSIKLTHVDYGFEKLKRCRQQSMDLELIGRGQYFKDHGLHASEICNSQLDKYYHFDIKYSYTDSMKL